LKRREDWPERLLQAVEARREKPFAWGENDCALFAADCVLAMTGEDLARAFRGRYDSARGALRVLRGLGARDLAQAVMGSLGEPIAPALARRGDVVQFETESEGPALGVCLGNLAAAAGPQGVAWVPAGQWLRAWRV
jgi:hypothetical protein